MLHIFSCFSSYYFHSRSLLILPPRTRLGPHGEPPAAPVFLEAFCLTRCIQTSLSDCSLGRVSCCQLAPLCSLHSTILTMYRRTATRNVRQYPSGSCWRPPLRVCAWVQSLRQRLRASTAASERWTGATRATCPRTSSWYAGSPLNSPALPVFGAGANTRVAQAVPELAINPLAQRILQMFENVNFKDFCLMLSNFSERATAEDRIRFLFNVYDVDGDGYISRSDLLTMLRNRAGSQLPCAPSCDLHCLIFTRSLLKL